MLGLTGGSVFAFLSTSYRKPLLSRCKEAASAQLDANGPKWNGWRPSLKNARFQDAPAAGLSVESVNKSQAEIGIQFGRL